MTMAQEEAFPRGGGRPLSGTAKKRLREEGEAAAVRDFQAEQVVSAKRGRSAKKVSSDAISLGTSQATRFRNSDRPLHRLLMGTSSRCLRAPRPHRRPSLWPHFASRWSGRQQGFSILASPLSRQTSYLASAADHSSQLTAHWLQNIAVGARILGVVSEIGPQELTISLPHGLRGFVDADEVSQTHALMQA